MLSDSPLFVLVVFFEFSGGLFVVTHHRTYIPIIGGEFSGLLVDPVDFLYLGKDEIDVLCVEIA